MKNNIATLRGILARTGINSQDGEDALTEIEKVLDGPCGRCEAINVKCLKIPRNEP